MDVFADLGQGILAMLTVQNVLLLGAGVLLGMVVGVMPGLGPSAGLAILLPLTFALDPTGAIIMLAAVYYGAMYGGTITSVLINTPGESATVASTFDGYPLARKGRAGPALVIAAVASFVAGTVGAVLISVAAPLTAAVAASFGPPELFLVVVAGLLTLIVIIGRNRLLGALSAAARLRPGHRRRRHRRRRAALHVRIDGADQRDRLHPGGDRRCSASARSCTPSGAAGTSSGSATYG